MSATPTVNCTCSCHNQTKNVSSSTTLVDSYYGALNRLHGYWKIYFPVTYIVYHGCSLEADTELTEVMNRVAYISAFYFIVRKYALIKGQWFLLLPFVPLFIDLLRFAIGTSTFDEGIKNFSSRIFPFLSATAEG